VTRTIAAHARDDAPAGDDGQDGDGEDAADGSG